MGDEGGPRAVTLGLGARVEQSENGREWMRRGGDGATAQGPVGLRGTV